MHVMQQYQNTGLRFAIARYRYTGTDGCEFQRQRQDNRDNLHWHHLCCCRYKCRKLVVLDKFALRLTCGSSACQHSVSSNQITACFASGHSAATCNNDQNCAQHCIPATLSCSTMNYTQTRYFTLRDVRTAFRPS